MTPIKPYLIRAVYEWVIDNNFSPYINVDATNPLVTVPKQYIENGCVILDISPESTNQLIIDNEAITCQVKFNGLVCDLYLPISAILAIYAQENNQGMVFPKEDENFESNQPTTPKDRSKQLKLKVIEGGKDQTKR